MSSTSPHKPREADPTPRLTLCLAMDLMGSTTSGLKLSTRKLDRFNLALVNQLRPHLSAMQLEHAVVKFTGDGWLVMSDDQEHAAPLCCLAIIMAKQFQAEVASDAGLPKNAVPTMRLALCWGRDLPVTLPDGQRDFVGNSVRRAVRASQLCKENEILIDETVRTWVAHDFRTAAVDVGERVELFKPQKMEEELVLHVLVELKTESATDADAPICFVSALSIIGRATEADDLAGRISDQLVQETASHRSGEAALLSKWNDLLAANLDYGTARTMLARLVDAGLTPDVNTYNALIGKAQDYRDQSKWLQQMIQEGIRPNVLTLNTLLRQAKDAGQAQRRLQKMASEQVEPNPETMEILVEKAPDFDTALAWMERMDASCVEPTGRVYETLIEKAEDFESARALIERMFDRDIQPSETAFISLFSKDISNVPAGELLAWYLGLRYHPTHPVKRAIAEYRRKGMIEDALRLALDYPHTDTALRLIRKFADRALAYFRSVVDRDPEHPNGAYALGMALLETGDSGEAERWLRRAYALATPGTRKDELARFLSLLEHVNPPTA